MMSIMVEDVEVRVIDVGVVVHLVVHQEGRMIAMMTTMMIVVEMVEVVADVMIVIVMVIVEMIIIINRMVMCLEEVLVAEL